MCDSANYKKLRKPYSYVNIYQTLTGVTCEPIFKVQTGEFLSKEGNFRRCNSKTKMMIILWKIPLLRKKNHWRPGKGCLPLKVGEFTLRGESEKGLSV